ncbi:MAG: polysaccharide deacetylase family protein [Chloroflexota bacterium]
MRIPGVKTAKVFSRWLRARVFGGAIILGYHRVVNATFDEYEVCVTPEHFEEHMDAVNKYTRPISVSKLVQHLKEGSLPARSLAVTFDDGYADNLYQAKPILEKYQVPATIFVCTGYVGKEFWWDELERLVMQSKAEPATLRFQVGESHFQWNKPTMRAEARSLEDVSIRRKLRHALYHFLLLMDIEEQVYAMDAIRSWSGLAMDKSSDHHAMSRTELLQLTEDGLVDLGAHTKTHPMLPRLSLERQREEIVSGKQELEELSGRQVVGFAYPNGRTTDDAKRIVRDAGFAYACTSLRDMVRPGCDTYELTRFWQQDVDGEKFMQGLNLWMSTQKN